MGLNTALGTSMSGLRSSQVGIGIVSQNVANAGTPGYVRRNVSNVDSINGGTVGVGNPNVQRLLDRIVQHQLLQESSGAAYTSTRAQVFANLDQLYGAPGSKTALDSMYSSFTNSLQVLHNDPSSYTNRTAVLDAASQLANRLRGLSDGVQQQRSQAEAGIGSAVWQRRATRLEVLSEAAIAFITIISAQRRIEIFDEQIEGFGTLIPLLQKRVQEGASSPAETLRAQVAADLFRVERERAKTQLALARRDLAILMGDSSPHFGKALGRLTNIGQPPPFRDVLRAIEANPQLLRWTAVAAQRNAELLIARLKAIPDPRISAGWRHYQDTNDNAVRLGVSIPIPIFDQNTGNIIAAQETLAKTDAERAINKLVLTSIVGRAYDTLTGALAELKLLRTSIIPNARSASETIQSGYLQGRFTLLELLDVKGSVLQALLREQEALQNFHIAIATIEGLVGNPFTLTRETSR